MGKATIQSSLGAGQYNILYHRNIARIQARIAKIQAEVQTLNTVDLPVYTAAWEQSEASLVSLIEALNVAIAAGEEAEMQRAASYVQTARVQVESAKSALDNLKLKILSLEKEVTFLQANQPPDEARQAWCADLNVALSGVVGTMEIPGEAETILIKPGGEAGTSAGFDQAADGFMAPALALSPEESFYNLAMLPGWQKWQPTYRIGTITALDANTCDINLDAAASSQQALDVNSQDILASVPIEYMSCNGGAFKVGDRVVVKFTGTGPGSSYIPKVIGFEMNPKGCGFKIKLTVDGDGTPITPARLIAGIYKLTFPSGWERPAQSFGIFIYDSFNDFVTGGWLNTPNWELPAAITYDNEYFTLLFPTGYIPPTGNTGFWISYKLNNMTLFTQYPHRYMAIPDEFQQPGDLVQPGTFVDGLPRYGQYNLYWQPAWQTPNIYREEIISSVSFRVRVAATPEKWRARNQAGDYLYYVKDLTVIDPSGASTFSPARFVGINEEITVEIYSVIEGATSGKMFETTRSSLGANPDLPDGYWHDIRLSYASVSLSFNPTDLT